MATTWIVAADASRARILQVAGPQRLVEIHNLLNPEGRLQNREVNTDEVPKDLSWFNERELESYFAKER